MAGKLKTFSSRRASDDLDYIIHGSRAECPFLGMGVLNINIGFLGEIPSAPRWSSRHH